MCANFQANWRTLTFLALIYPQKIDLPLEIQKINVGITINILEISCVPFSGKTDNFDFLGPNLPKSGFLGWNFKNLSADSESTPQMDHMYQFSVKMDNR